VQRRDGVRRTLVASLALAAVAALLCTFAAAGPATAASTPPAPDLAHFIPVSDQITSTRQIHLSSSGPAQEVVDFESAEPDAQGKTPVDLIILSWDRFAKRWVTVWDGAKVEAPDSGPSSGGLAYDSVFPSAAYISNLSYRPITSAKGRTDLEFDDDYSFGTNGSVEVGIVHYDGQVASLAYFDTFNPGDGQPKVINKAPHQELSIPIGWLTDADPQCCAVRTYVNTVALHKQTQSDGYSDTSYIVTKSTQSWLGVYALFGQWTNGTWPNPVVMAVVPGGPAAGVLQVGDQLVSVVGVSAPSAGNGPAVLDEVAKELPGTTIALTIMRGETQRVVNITLGSTVSPAYIKDSTAPSPSYLGVSTTSMTPALQSQYGLVPSTGAIVLSVAENSAAAIAGFVQGDVITAFGSAPVTSAASLQNAIELTPSGSTVQVGYTDTSGDPQTASVTLGLFPSDSPGPQVTPI